MKLYLSLGRRILSFGFLLGFSFLHAAEKKADRKPNIIFILADDLGYGDIGSFGQEKIKTPNLDRMAAEGMKLTNFYCGCSVCAPSRCTLLTGKHTGHSTVRDNMQRAPGAEGQHPMEPGTVTAAQLLKKAGYATAIVGKWGLGMPEDKSSPLDYGFDHQYGYLCQGIAHTYYPPYLRRDNQKEMLEGNPPYEIGMKGVIEPGGKVYSQDRMAEDALRWVRDHKDQPFFFYYAFTIPHVSLQATDADLAEYKGKFPETPVRDSKHYANVDAPRAAYAAMISRMDRDIGDLLDLVQQLKLDDNTIVFFASDNGAVFPLSGTDPEFFKSNGILRGFKQDLYEGGIRSPFIARWPGHIKAGSVSEQISAFWDMMPTWCDLAGLPTPKDIDGLSLAPTLLGKPGQKNHDYLYWEYQSAGRAQAVRFGQWKAIRNQAKKNPDATPELYDLSTDPGEKINVAADHPDIVAKAVQYMKQAHAPSWEPKWNW